LSAQRAVRRLRLTGRRLHAGGGSTKVRAGDKLPDSHKMPAGIHTRLRDHEVAPKVNRSL